MKRVMFFILLLIALTACQKKQNVSEIFSDYVIKVSSSQVCEEKLPLPILFDSVEVFFPDRRDSVLLGNIMGVRYTGKDYFIFDDFQQLFQFSPEGKLVHNLTNIGRGPFEYIYLKDAYYDRSSQQFVVLTSPYYKLEFIDSSGNYIREVSLPFDKNGYECLFPLKNSLLVLGNCFNDENQYWGTISYFNEDSLTPLQVLHERKWKGGYSAKFWAIGETENREIVIGYKSPYDTLCILSPEGTLSKQVLKLQWEHPYKVLYYRYQYNGLMMINASFDKGELLYSYYCLLHDRISGNSRMWNSEDFSLIGSYVCADRENLYFVYTPVNEVLVLDTLRKYGYGSLLEKIEALQLTEGDNPVILRFHLRSPDELRNVLVSGKN